MLSIIKKSQLRLTENSFHGCQKFENFSWPWFLAWFDWTTLPGCKLFESYWHWLREDEIQTSKKLQLQLKTSKTNEYQRRYDLFWWKVIKLPFVWMRMNYWRFFQSATGEVTSQNFYFRYFIYLIYDRDPYTMNYPALLVSLK